MSSPKDKIVHRAAKALPLSVDDDSQRGRKRRRSEASTTPAPTVHNPSGGSTTLRGRGRRRSSSQAGSDTTDPTLTKPRSSFPPGRKYQKKFPEVERKRRSQSPSRSRSKEGQRTPRRRRQRTRSRSRTHNMRDSMKKGSGADFDARETRVELDGGSKSGVGDGSNT